MRYDDAHDNAFRVEVGQGLTSVAVFLVIANAGPRPNTPTCDPFFFTVGWIVTSIGSAPRCNHLFNLGTYPRISGIFVKIWCFAACSTPG